MGTTNNQSETTATKPLFMRMEEETEFSQMTLEQQEIYMRSLDTWRTVMAAEEFTFNKGYKEGFEIGIAEGLAEANIETAKRMIAAGVPETLVLSTLGLNKEDL